MPYDLLLRHVAISPTPRRARWSIFPKQIYKPTNYNAHHYGRQNQQRRRLQRDLRVMTMGFGPEETMAVGENLDPGNLSKANDGQAAASCQAVISHWRNRNSLLLNPCCQK